jgi:hypothetical protein
MRRSQLGKGPEENVLGRESELEAWRTGHC